MCIVMVTMDIDDEEIGVLKSCFFFLSKFCDVIYSLQDIDKQIADM